MAAPSSPAILPATRPAPPPGRRRPGAEGRDHGGERVLAADQELDVAGPAAKFTDLARPGTEPVGEGVEAPGPVGGLLADHHAHRDPIDEAAGPHPHDPGDVLVAVEPAPEAGEHHRGAPPDPVGPERAPQPQQHRDRRSDGTSRDAPATTRPARPTAAPPRQAGPRDRPRPRRGRPGRRGRRGGGGGPATRPSGAAGASSGGPRCPALAPTPGPASVRLSVRVMAGSLPARSGPDRRRPPRPGPGRTPHGGQLAADRAAGR